MQERVCFQQKNMYGTCSFANQSDRERSYCRGVIIKNIYRSYRATKLHLFHCIACEIKPWSVIHTVDLMDSTGNGQQGLKGCVNFIIMDHISSSGGWYWSITFLELWLKFWFVMFFLGKCQLESILYVFRISRLRGHQSGVMDYSHQKGPIARSEKRIPYILTS